MATSGYTLEPVQVTDLKVVAEDVLFRAPGKNDLEIRKAICEAARQFLERTGVWKERRRCTLAGDGVCYQFSHGYLHARVLRIDCFQEGMPLQRMTDVVLDGVAPIPCGIALPRVGNPACPSIAQFVEQGGYVFVAAPGCGLTPEIPAPYQPEDQCVPPVMAGPRGHECGVVVFTLGLAFTGESMPETLIQQYGSIIADGAAHLLLTGPNVSRSAYGDRFTNACDTLAMRMANGGPAAAITGTIVDGLVEV